MSFCSLPPSPPFPLHSFIDAGFPDRDINKIDTIPTLSSLPIEAEGEHARRILRHYEGIFPSTTSENTLLKCLGLLDRPATLKTLDAVRQGPPISGLTKPLIGLS
jgi:hypothetical protein